jgi:hypothetical protein
LLLLFVISNFVRFRKSDNLLKPNDTNQPDIHDANGRARIINIQ